MLAKKILYGILEPVLLAWFAEHGKTLVHCSAVEKGGITFIFPAWGGVGKTSLMSFFLAAGWNYLSDDIAVISREGQVYHFPLPMHIYGYHKFVCANMYWRMIENMTPTERHKWNLSMKLYPPNKICRWIKPEDIYGKGRIATYGTLQTVIHMQKSTIDEPIVCRKITPETIARYTTNTIINEVPEIILLTSYPNSHSVIPCFPDTHHMLDNLKRNACRGFSHANIYEMIVNTNTTPEDIWNYLKEKFPWI